MPAIAEESVTGGTLARRLKLAGMSENGKGRHHYQEWRNSRDAKKSMKATNSTDVRNGKDPSNSRKPKKQRLLQQQ
jgi:hypothetical protein